MQHDMDPRKVERLPESRFSRVVRAEETLGHGVRVEKGVRIAPHVGHGVREKIPPAVGQFVQHGVKGGSGVFFQLPPVTPQLVQSGFPWSGNMLRIDARQVKHPVAVQRRPLRFRQGRRGKRRSRRQSVDLALHILNGLFHLRDCERVHGGNAEMRVHLRAGGSVVNRSHAHPCVDDRREGFALRVRAARRATGGEPVRNSDSFSLGPLFLRELVKHVEHPAPELLGDGGAREHGEKVAAAKGEDAGFLRAALRRKSDNRRHRIREFVGVRLIQFADGSVRIFVLAVSQ